MSTKEKLILRLKEKPKDFTFDEAERLLGCFGYRRSNKGRTSGSRVCFVCNDHAPIDIHHPHPANTLKQYQVKQLLEILTQEGLI